MNKLSSPYLHNRLLKLYKHTNSDHIVVTIKDSGQPPPPPPPSPATMREVEVDDAVHLLFVSFPAQGHINPLLRLAKRVAAKGSLVTFSTTLDIGRRIRAAHSIPADDSVFTVVGRGFLRFDFFDDGADPDDPHRDDLPNLMARLESNGPRALSDLIRGHSSAGRPVSCLVNNPFVPWALDVAAEFAIPSAVLWVQSCAVFSAYYHFDQKLASFPSDNGPDITVNLPGTPPLFSGDLPSFLLPSNPFQSITKVILAQFDNISKARWVFANSFDELEHDTLEGLAEIFPVVPVGPLLDNGEHSCIKADMWKAAGNCIHWLTMQKPSSVVYVSLGSIVKLSALEMTELAAGLKISGRPFLWVVRDDLREFLPAGFEDEVMADGKSMIVGWSPQERVLSSAAVGCFVTHCGWNSTLEALAAGVPVVAYPQWGDQMTNAKFLCEVYGVGIRVPARVTADEVVRYVARAMDGEEAESMKAQCRKWSKLARAAVAGGGSSDKNIEKFIGDVRKLVAQGPAFDNVNISI